MRAPRTREVHRRARRSIRVLLLRAGVLQLVALASGVVVARVLGPTQLGIFGIALFVVTVLALVADLGLKPALIQRAAALGGRELETSLALRLALVTAIVALLFLAAPSLAALYPGVPPELAWLIRVLALDLYLRGWRATSEVQLERELRYEHLALAEVIGNVTQQTVAIGLVLGGWGLWSLVWALLAGGLGQALVLQWKAPWPLRVAFDPAAARELLRVGIPLQASQLVSLAPAWVTPTLVAALLGPEAVGLLNWAGGVGRKPLEVLDSAVRVSLPHFSRLQDDEREVERALSRYVVASLLVCGLWFAVLCVAGHDLVALVYTERWLPALPALLLYAAAASPISVRVIMTSALVGLGRVRFTARVIAVAALVSLASSVLLVFAVGFLGVPLGLIVGLHVAVPWLSTGLGPGVGARILRHAKPVLAPVGAAIAVGAVALLAPVPPAVRGLLVAAVMSATYAGAAWCVGPEWLRAGVREEIAPARRRESSAP